MDTGRVEQGLTVLFDMIARARRYEKNDPERFRMLSREALLISLGSKSQPSDGSLRAQAFPDRRFRPSTLFQPRLAGGVSPGGALPISCQLRGCRPDRDPRNLLHGSCVLSCGCRTSHRRSAKAATADLAGLRILHWRRDSSPARWRNSLGSRRWISAMAVAIESSKCIINKGPGHSESAEDHCRGSAGCTWITCAAGPLDPQKPAHTSPSSASGAALCQRHR